MTDEWKKLKELLAKLPERERTEIGEAIAEVVAGEIVAMVADADGVQEVSQKLTVGAPA